MRVSVIVPCWNAADFIAETLESVLAQTHPPAEIIVVDDGSTDGSADVVARFGDRVRLVTGPHAGVNVARNRGFAASTGDHVMFLDADDVLSPGVLAGLAAALEDAATAVAACDWRRLLFVDGAWSPAPRDVDARPRGGDALRAWLRGSFYVPPCAVLWPRAVLDAVGPWDEALVINTDGDMMMRALLAGIPLVFAKGGEALYRRHGGTGRRSVSMGQSEQDLRSRMRVIEKVEAALASSGRLAAYAVDVGCHYHQLARWNFAGCPALATECDRRARRIAGGRAVCGSWPHRLLCHALGLPRKERLAAALAALGVGRAARADRT
jgi:glycosyltransferase involved in cell wall biosynthesis